MTPQHRSSPRHRHRDRRCRRARRIEAGAASIQLVLLLPVLFAVMFTGMQAALYYHARTVAIAAAEEGARAVGAQGGSPGQGVQAASAFIASAGGNDVLQTVHANASRDATTATVTVSGQAMSVIPGWSPSITGSASVPVERLTSPADELTNPAGGRGGN